MWKMSWIDRVREFLWMTPSKQEIAHRMAYIAEGNSWPPVSPRQWSQVPPSPAPQPPSPPPVPKNP